MSCPGALRRAPALSVSGPNALALFVGSRALCVGTSALCPGPWRSVSGPGALSGPSVLFVGPSTLSQRSLRRGPVPGALCGRPPCGALCVGPRRSVCVGPRPSLAACVEPRRQTPALFVSGPAAVSGPGALSLSVSGPGALCQGPAPVVSGPGILCVGSLSVSGSVSGPGALPPLFLCRAQHSLALFVGPRHPLRRGPALSVSGLGAGPCALSVSGGAFPFFQERTPNLTVWGKTLNPKPKPSPPKTKPKPTPKP